ncbi:hypothetical protein [Treponema sp. UBA3813]|uniref:hypothetical protein n=1 Tax=Treponema sp. UBA3813 TaxID=1947715 RepID=UPI0025EF69EE|nr:hypothetical protein [Treponema sp. UBA3813]
MTNEEMKRALAQSGMATAEIEKVSEKYDAEKITELVETANTPEEAFAALHAVYPELEVEALQKQCDFVKEQVEAAINEQKQKQNVPMELTEEELDNVAGGGFFDSVGSWFKNNWKAVAVGAAIVVGAALVCTGVGAGVGAAITYFTSHAALSAMGASLSYSTFALVAGYTCTPILTGTGAAIGAAVGTAVGGTVTGALAGTGNLPN